MGVKNANWNRFDRKRFRFWLSGSFGRRRAEKIGVDEMMIHGTRLLRVVAFLLLENKQQLVDFDADDTAVTRRN